MMRYKAYAELSLPLNVHGKYFNGCHSIESIMLPVNLYDELEIEVISGCTDIIIEYPDKKMSQNKDNILYRCARLFQNEFKIRDGVKIYIHKNIPAQSGLTGESADAACLMYFYNETYKLNLSFNYILSLGRLLYWDVPLCYLRKCVYINSKTNVCDMLAPKSNLYFLLIQPDFGISVKNAYEILDRINQKTIDSGPLLNALQHSPEDIGKYIYNCFIETDSRLINEYGILQQQLKELGFDGICMSGTGSCFFGITTDPAVLQDGYQFFHDQYSFVVTTSLLL